MANGSFSIALGRESEFHWRVDNNDPTNAALIMVVLAASGLVDDSTLSAYDDLAALLAGASNEVTNAGYARNELDQGDISAFVVDDSAHTITLPLANQTFTAIAAGDSWAKLLICYDSDTTGGTDANIIPVKYYDIRNPVTNVAVVPTGNNIIFSFPDGYHVAD